MPIQRLLVTQFRNLLQVDVQPSPDINLLYGQNGSGKTSLLESVYLLSLGRSFRSHKIKPLINESASELTVFGKSSAASIGITRPRRGDSQFKVNGSRIASLAELTRSLPVLVINSDTFRLIEGGPKERRQLLDWLVFHVEPGFFITWKNASRCLKQRNAMLRRDRIPYAEFHPWDRELAGLSQLLADYRRCAFDQFKAVFLSLVEEFVQIESLTVELEQGWDTTGNLLDILEQHFDRDKKQGFTGTGFHRADIKIKVGSHKAEEVLSRGQQKLLVCALILAQCMVFQQTSGKNCILLVDDLPSELDDKYQTLMVNWINKLNCQVFVTGVDVLALSEPWGKMVDRDIKVFHVEHGEIKHEERLALSETE
ncbi:DNA replication/repair protein RecF [Gilvimarinus sp. 1_MG-2023]|uniref:DNA replication/repair protein RecF n=1 Tax=Gilvimarinus sp. 1_MG-2023 TaxID=3062638 RepID=UPI0026E48D97|nr:DNA replication/repair protein RecF [Gilvimarinus sp. 1_MG-2023]MDO6747510.1 DNA replication/repair protein RecF [Gilvimarinus sp. 1_MG-2023]